MLAEVGGTGEAGGENGPVLAASSAKGAGHPVSLALEEGDDSPVTLTPLRAVWRYGPCAMPAMPAMPTMPPCRHVWRAPEASG